MSDPTSEAPTSAPVPASLGRVFAACFYDALLSVAILFATGAVAVALNGGQAVPSGDPLLRLALLAIAFPYYGFCWTHGGQTLGMRTWRVRAVSPGHDRISWLQAIRRYLGAVLSLGAFGVGFLWILLDRQHCSWHDRLSGTRLIVLPAGRSP